MIRVPNRSLLTTLPPTCFLLPELPIGGGANLTARGLEPFTLKTVELSTPLFLVQEMFLRWGRYWQVWHASKRLRRENNMKCVLVCVCECVCARERKVCVCVVYVCVCGVSVCVEFESGSVRDRKTEIQGYLAHKKQQPP